MRTVTSIVITLVLILLGLAGILSSFHVWYYRGKDKK